MVKEVRSGYRFFFYSCFLGRRNRRYLLTDKVSRKWKARPRRSRPHGLTFRGTSAQTPSWETSHPLPLSSRDDPQARTRVRVRGRTEVPDLVWENPEKERKDGRGSDSREVEASRARGKHKQRIQFSFWNLINLHCLTLTRFLLND